jgi:hypothetical protein
MTEIQEVNEERVSSELDCITQHRAFSDNCLNEYDCPENQHVWLQALRFFNSLILYKTTNE